MTSISQRIIIRGKTLINSGPVLFTTTTTTTAAAAAAAATAAGHSFTYGDVSTLGASGGHTEFAVGDVRPVRSDYFVITDTAYTVRRTG